MKASAKSLNITIVGDNLKVSDLNAGRLFAGFYGGGLPGPIGTDKLFALTWTGVREEPGDYQVEPFDLTVHSCN